MGQTLEPEESCRHRNFTIQVEDSGTLRIRFTGDRVDLSNAPTLARNGNSWRIESLP